MGLKSQKFYVFFPCNPMEPFISGVRPSICFYFKLVFQLAMTSGL